MDIEITASDPSEVDLDEVFEALEGAGYYVESITVLDRMNFVHKSMRSGEEDE